jgi:hypothetical protein
MAGMNLKSMIGMLEVLFSAIRLAVLRRVSFAFIINILMLKILRKLGVKYLVVVYNKNLRYLCPLNQTCDWFHVTVEPFEFNGIFEPKEGEIIVDVGANIGVYSLYCSQKVCSKGNVIAIEPEPRNFAILLHNIGLNKMSNVTALNLCISDHSGKVKLFLTSPTVTQF